MPRDDGCFRPTLAAGVLSEERLNSLSTARWDKPVTWAKRPTPTF